MPFNMEKIWDTIYGFLSGAALPAVLILVVGIIIVRIILGIVSRALERSKLEKAAFTLIKTVIRVLLYGLLLLIIASKLGIDVTGIVALASVLTLAISLAVQSALTNLISGFTLLYTKPFSSGDFVEIAGQSGSVQEIGLTYTKLQTPDSKSVCIPNSAVTATEIINYTVLGKRRVAIEVGVSYDSPTELVLEALREAGNVPTRLEDTPAFAAMLSYGENTINYVLHVWCAADDYWTTLFDTNAKIREIFAEKGVIFTYPHLNVHLDK